MTAERINALAEICGAKRYLEVGVCKGETFFEVNIPYKVAVDPHFLFDTNLHENKNTAFYSIPSDTFFKKSTDTPFDLIFLDGLHTYEQNTRDFLNSLRFSHAKTIWLIDDTVPNDVFSALPDQDRCYRLRSRVGRDDWSWMGDVFKTVFFIERSLPSVHYRTFAGRGQTVAWQAKQVRDVQPSTVGLDRIGSMSYADFIDNIDTMQIADDDTLYATVRSFIGNAR